MIMTQDLLRALSAGRWLIPVLAAMADEEGSRFSVLARRLCVSKSVLSGTLGRLEAEGWVGRNPGHGHPLRPEYVLTAEGQAVAAWCARIMAQRQAIGIDRGTLGRWSLPLIEEIGAGRKRFSALQRDLVPISPRALTLELSSLINVSLVHRWVPGPLYGLTDRGRSLASVFRLA